MSTDDTNAARRGPGSNDLLGLGPERLSDADMDALAAVAHQAGLAGIDLAALARALDAAQRIAVAAERERWESAVRAVLADWNKWDEVTAHEIQRLALKA